MSQPATKATCSIRPLAPHDRPAWELLWRAYLDFYETTLPAEQYELTWTRLQNDAEPMHVLGAFTGEERLVGIAHVIFHRSCWLPEVTCYLQDLYVAGDLRGKGTGAALIEAVADFARAHKAGRLYWLTQAGNATAQRLYDGIAERSGFIQYRKAL